MKRTEFIAKRLREVCLNGKWVANTNIKELIESVSWEQATHKVGSLNTIALLTYHMNYYLAGLVQVLDGGPLEMRDKYSFDMPSIESEEDWKKLIDDFLRNSERVAAQIEQMSEEKLDGPFADPKYGAYNRNLEGIIEHNYYHLGQISLLKKLILTNTTL